MTRPRGSAGFIPRVSRTTAHDAVREALRAFVGTGRPWSVKMLANESGVADRLIEAAMAEVGSTERRALSFDRLLSIAAVLGAEFTAACLAPASQGAFDLPDAASLDPVALMTEVTGRAHQLVILAADNDFCANDYERMLPIAHAKLDLAVRMLAVISAIRMVAAGRRWAA